MKLIFFLRSLFAIVYFLFVTIVLGLFVIILALFFGSVTTKKIKKIQDWAIGFWAQSSLRCFGIQLEIQGLDLLIKENGGIILFNHTSHFDVLAIYAALPHIRFGAKIELFSIPIFGRAMRSVGALPIARKNRKEVFRIYKEAEIRFKQGQIFALAPEGTRQEDEKVLGTFKKGPFIFAKNAGVPVQTVVVQGASNILQKHKLIPHLDHWRSVIRLKIFPAISTHEKSIESLQEQVLEEMQSQLRNH